MKSDSHLNELKNRAAKFLDNFTYEDSQGRTRLDTDLLGSMKSNIIPFIVDRIKEIPIPRVEVHNKDFEYLILDDMFLTIDDILPNQIRIHSENNTDFSLKSLDASHSHTHIKFLIEGIKPKVKDFYFSFKKKGMIKVTDEGRASVKIIGQGLDIYMTFDVKMSGEHRAILGGHKVKVNVHKIDIDILDANHKTMLNMATTLFKGRIETQIEESLAKKLDSLGYDWAVLINDRVLAKVPTPGGVVAQIEEKVVGVL